MNILKTDMGRPITALALIGIVDMLFTGVGLTHGRFGEANPMLDWAWMGYGIFGFMALKSAFIFGTNLVFTWARTRQPYTTDRYARVAIAPICLSSLWALVPSFSRSIYDRYAREYRPVLGASDSLLA